MFLNSLGLGQSGNLCLPEVLVHKRTVEYLYTRAAFSSFQAVTVTKLVWEVSFFYNLFNVTLKFNEFLNPPTIFLLEYLIDVPHSIFPTIQSFKTCSKLYIFHIKLLNNKFGFSCSIGLECRISISRCHVNQRNKASLTSSKVEDFTLFLPELTDVSDVSHNFVSSLLILLQQYWCGMLHFY